MERWILNSEKPCFCNINDKECIDEIYGHKFSPTEIKRYNIKQTWQESWDLLQFGFGRFHNTHFISNKVKSRLAERNS